jgi:hypothetical protein
MAAASSQLERAPGSCAGGAALTSGLPQIETCDPIANLNYRELYVHIAGARGNITKQWSHTLASASLARISRVAGANAVITS